MEAIVYESTTYHSVNYLLRWLTTFYLIQIYGQSHGQEINVASVEHGATCDASTHQDKCKYAIDSSKSIIRPNLWAIKGNAVGEWIKITLFDTCTLDLMRIMQGARTDDKNVRNVSIVANNGNTREAVLKFRGSSLKYEDVELNPPIYTNSVTIVILDVYSSDENVWSVFVEIQLYMLQQAPPSGFFSVPVISIIAAGGILTIIIIIIAVIYMLKNKKPSCEITESEADEDSEEDESDSSEWKPQLPPRNRSTKRLRNDLYETTIDELTSDEYENPRQAFRHAARQAARQARIVKSFQSSTYEQLLRQKSLSLNALHEKSLFSCEEAYDDVHSTTNSRLSEYEVPMDCSSEANSNIYEDASGNATGGSSFNNSENEYEYVDDYLVPDLPT